MLLIKDDIECFFSLLGSYLLVFISLFSYFSVLERSLFKTQGSAGVNTDG